MSRAGRVILLGVVTLMATSVAGCSSSGLPAGAVPPVPASGNVFYKGKPLTKGSVLVVPDDGQPAAGEIKDGHFTLTTYVMDDGAIPGKHKVAVIATEEEKAKKGGESTTKSLLPAKYASAETSKLLVEIPDKGTSELKIEVD